MNETLCSWTFKFRNRI